jgi:hypothetical protein
MGLEDGADVSSAWTGGGFVGAGYRASENLSLQLGVAVTSRLEDDAQVMPMFAADWKIDENWRLNAGALELGVADVVGVGVMYRIDKQWSLGARTGWVSQWFRLDDSGVAPEGVGHDERIRAALVLKYRPSDNVRVALLGGVELGGELEVQDESGDSLFTEDYDAAPFVGARLTWEF